VQDVARLKEKLKHRGQLRFKEGKKAEWLLIPVCVIKQHIELCYLWQRKYSPRRDVGVLSGLRQTDRHRGQPLGLVNRGVRALRGQLYFLAITARIYVFIFSPHLLYLFFYFLGLEEEVKYILKNLLSLLILQVHQQTF